MIQRLQQLEAGMYEDAAEANLTFSAWLEREAREGQISGDLVRVGAERPQRSNGSPLTAFEQLLLQAGIGTVDRPDLGFYAATGDAFFSDPTNRTLFPEFIATAYRDLDKYPLNMVRAADLVAAVDFTSNSAYKVGVISKQEQDGTGDEDGLEFGRVTEGAHLPVYVVMLAEHSIGVYKYGGLIKITYEAVRRARLSILQMHVRKVARAQEYRKAKQALAVALNGDGNSNPASNTAAAGTSFVLTDLIALQLDMMEDGAQPNLLTGDRVDIEEVLSLSVVTDKDSTAMASQYRDTGGWPLLLGMSLKAAPAGSVFASSNKLMGVDQSLGLIEVRETGSEITETDRLITTQFERIAISENIGYAKPDIDGFATKTHT